MMPKELEFQCYRTAIKRNKRQSLRIVAPSVGNDIKRFYAIKHAEIRLPSTNSNFSPMKYQEKSRDEIIKIDEQNLQPNSMAYYKRPLLITQGYMQWVYDETGKRYLDMFGGICTVAVGHCHPKLIKVATDQIQTLWHTSGIYFNPKAYEYAEKIVKTLPENLKVCYFVNSGTEANDVAMMLARLYTGCYNIISLRNSYHGGSPPTAGLTGMSTWKHNFPHGFGIIHAMNPNVYTGIWGGLYCRDSPVQTTRKCDCKPNNCQAGENYIKELEDIFTSSLPGGKLAGFFAEPIQGLGGIVQYPKNYLAKAFELTRRHGGLCIADEVQTGFGRTGDTFWGFEMHGVIPDIVTMAKSIANGLPMGLVITTPEIAQAMSKANFLSTFGGNPIACASASAVLDIISEENLQENSRIVGTYLLKELAKLRDEFEIIGDVRGKGCMIGVELVTDKISRKPLTSDKMAQIWEHCKDLGLLMGRGGCHRNVFRVQPPMCITKDDADFTAAVLREAVINCLNGNLN